MVLKNRSVCTEEAADESRKVFGPFDEMRESALFEYPFEILQIDIVDHLFRQL
jgi:hypothetical protein